MSSETESLLKQVLGFYQSSGMLSPNDAAGIRIDISECHSLECNQQQLENLLFFTLGTLLPDFLPGTISVRSAVFDSRTFASFRFGFPGTTTMALKDMADSLVEDPRFRRIADSSGASLKTHSVPENPSERALELLFPVQGIHGSPPSVIIDFPELEARFGDTDIARTLLDGFIMNAGRHISLLKTAVENGDWKEAHRHAHALKGGALNICARNVSLHAKNLETSLKNNDYTDMTQFLDELERACMELERAWTEHQEGIRG